MTTTKLVIVGALMLISFVTGRWRLVSVGSNMLFHKPEV